MTRARLYVLVDAFERDVRAILGRYVIYELGEKEALRGSYERAAGKRELDRGAGESSAIADYLDMREAYDLLNTHRQMLPAELAVEVRELTASLDRLVGIRNRVMHARPLAAGDSDAAVSLLHQYRTRYWPETKRTLAQLSADPSWEPLVSAGEENGLTLHNLPLPDYDETGLVGRSKDVTEVTRLVKRRREPVVTITGEGGIGKTALALEVAYRIVDDLEKPFDAVLWTSLKYEKLTESGVQEIAGAARDIVGAIQPLGQTLDDGFQGNSKKLAEVLDGFSVLIVIDNMETVGGEEFTALYDDLPEEVSFLVTSRIGVGEFERRYPLRPLDEGDSLKLFSDFVRARRISGLDKVTRGTRIEVVTRLRNSPLAIRWFALAVEAGNDPLHLIRQQDQLLEFCVRSVYESLGDPAREVLEALAVLGRAVSIDELVVLLERPMDQINVGFQELIRGSLVRRESVSAPGDLTLRVLLTETASQFLGRRVVPDEKLRRAVLEREEEYRAIEERRAADLAERSLAPVVVRSRTESDAPTAQILRKALLAAKTGDFLEAFEQVDVARRLNPDFWEVDRVEGYLRSRCGETSASTACYQRAYENSDGDERAVVSHFFAGHLARSAKDVKRALGYAEEAHSRLNSPDTAVALGTYLIWAHRFSEGIGFIEPTIASLKGKARLIAISSLSDGYRRWAEYARGEERNPLLQHVRAKKGLDISLAALESGVSDDRLRDIAVDCALEALRAAGQCVRDGTTIRGLADWLDSLGKVLVRLAAARKWSLLSDEVHRFAKQPQCPAAGKRLVQAVERLDGHTSPVIDDDISVHLDERFIGEVVTLQERYGFIRHPAFPGNVFFHASDLLDSLDWQSVYTGALVSFMVVDSDRGPRAAEVARAN